MSRFRGQTILSNLEDAFSRSRTIRFFIVAGLMALVLVRPAAATDAEGDARELFSHFLAAQNDHDIARVRSMLWDSPEMLWFTRGVEVRGSEAVEKALAEHYAGTWHLDPDMAQFRSTVISDDVVQILVPIVFTRGLPGGPSQTDKFLISQTVVRTPSGWRVAAIIPVANTQIAK